MDRKKELINEYKQRKIVGGIFRVTNKKNGMYLLNYAANIKARQNAFDFTVSTSSCFHPKLRNDWAVFGANAFIFEILETLKKKEGQSQEEFLDDLKTLEQMWSDKLDSSKRY